MNKFVLIQIYDDFIMMKVHFMKIRDDGSCYDPPVASCFSYVEMPVEIVSV